MHNLVVTNTKPVEIWHRRSDGGWSVFDLSGRLQQRLREDIQDLRLDMRQMRQEMQEFRAEVRQEIHSSFRWILTGMIGVGGLVIASAGVVVAMLRP